MGDLPDVARSLNIDSVNIVPYYYFSSETGSRYEKELEENFGCSTFSWKGFYSEGSGIDADLFLAQLKKYKEKLGEVSNFSFMPLTDKEYVNWFTEPYAEVGIKHCNNVENLIDIQPDGNANFYIDFPDYSFGNIKENTISEIWNSKTAEDFRNYRRKKPLAVCYKCGAKYITEL